MWAADRHFRSELSWGSPYQTAFVPAGVNLWLVVVVAPPLLLIVTWLILKWK